MKVEKLKTHTVKSDYTVTVERNGKPQVSIAVKAESVAAALKAAYEKNCGWQRLPIEDLEG